MGQLILQPDEATAKDTQIDSSNPTTNFGTGASIQIGQIPKTPATFRGLIDWTISSIPAGSQILSTSKLEMNLTGFVGTGNDYEIHRITQEAWTELGVTWNKYDGTNNWATAGGDFSTPIVTYPGPLVGGNFIITGVDLAAFLQDALDNRSGIARMLFKNKLENSLDNYTADSSNGTIKPKLTIEFRPPGAILLGSWHFNENDTANVRDYSTKGLDSLSVSGLTIVSSDRGKAGKFQVVTNGGPTPTKVNFGDVGEPTIDELTIDFKLKFASVGVDQFIIDKNNQFRVELIGASNKIKFSVWIGTVQKTVLSTTVFTTGNFPRLICIYDGSQLEIIVDGTSDATTSSITGNVDSGTDDLLLGHKSDNTNGLKADLEVIEIWDVNLMPDEIATLDKNMGGIETTLLTNHNFSEGDLLEWVNDISGLSNSRVVVTLNKDATTVLIIPISGRFMPGLRYRRRGNLFNKTRQWLAEIKETAAKPYIFFKDAISSYDSDTPASDSVVDMSGITDRGHLLPSLTDAQRDLIISPTDGLLIVNKDAKALNIGFNKKWNDLSLRFVEKRIPSSQVRNLGGTFIELIAAPDSDHLIVIVGLPTVELIFNNVIYPDTGGDGEVGIQLRYDTVTKDIYNHSTILLASADFNVKMALITAIVPADSQIFSGKSVKIKSTINRPTGDSPIIIRAYYKIVDAASLFNNFSLDFDGVNEYLTIPDDDSLSFGDSVTDKPFSILAWVKLVDATSSTIISKRTASSVAEYLFIFGPDDQVGINLYDSTSSNRIAITSVDTFTADQGSWIFIVCTYDSSSNVSGLKLYKNGILISSTDTSAGTYVAMHNTVAAVNIGRFNSGLSFFDGKMSMMRLINKELSAAEILDAYNSGKVLNKNNLTFKANIISQWAMGDGSIFDGTNWPIQDDVDSNDATSVLMEQGDRIDDVPV